MFIVSKRSFKFRFKDAESFRIPNEFMGNIPDHVAQHPLFQAAVRGGEIMVPETTADKAIYKSDEEAAEARAAHDIRPDATKPAAKSRKTK